MWTMEYLNGVLGRRRRREIANNTHVAREDGVITIRLHGHAIAQVYHSSIVVNSCGYHTVTTKERLNRALEPFGWRIQQKNYTWYLRYDELEYYFQDNVRCAYDGTILGVTNGMANR